MDATEVTGESRFNSTMTADIIWSIRVSRDMYSVQTGQLQVDNNGGTAEVIVTSGYMVSGNEQVSARLFIGTRDSDNIRVGS